MHFHLQPAHFADQWKQRKPQFEASSAHHGLSLLFSPNCLWQNCHHQIQKLMIDLQMYPRLLYATAKQLRLFQLTMSNL
jgi:hypothetical protein